MSDKNNSNIKEVDIDPIVMKSRVITLFTLGVDGISTLSRNSEKSTSVTLDKEVLIFVLFK